MSYNATLALLLGVNLVLLFVAGGLYAALRVVRDRLDGAIHQRMQALHELVKTTAAMNALMQKVETRTRDAD